MPERPLAISLELLADRLSRYVYGRPADDLFLQRVRDAAPLTNIDVQALVRPLLMDSESDSTNAAFGLVRGWLKLDEDTLREAGARLGDQITPEAWQSIAREPRLFLSHLLSSGGNPTLTALLTAPYSLIDHRLAEIYGVPAPDAGSFVLADLSASARSGVLTQPAMLAAHPRASSRGAWVSEVFLCQPLADLPAAVPPLSLAAGTTYRESLESATTTCGGGCHARIDPLGFALEHFDDSARWRDTENGSVIDASVSLALDSDQGQGVVVVDGAAGLGRALATSCTVHRCVARRFLELAVGRALGTVEHAAVDEVSRAFVQSELDMRELLALTVGSEPFLDP